MELEREITAAATAAVAKYVAKLSGPLLDRVDLQIEVSRVAFDDMVRNERAERSQSIRERVIAARAHQLERFAGTPISCNAEIPGNAAQASAKRQFSARALDRIARAARTISDLAASDAIRRESPRRISYRSLKQLAHLAA